MSDLAFKSALELAAMIRNREISSAELTAHYIERIEKLDGPNLNAVPVRIFERAREGRGPSRRGSWRAERNSVPCTASR